MIRSSLSKTNNRFFFFFNFHHFNLENGWKQFRNWCCNPLNMEGKINNCWSVETKGILSLLDIISGVFQRWLIQNHKSCERFFRSFYSFLRFLPHQPLYRPCCSIGSISVVASGVLLLGQQHVLYTTLHWLVLWRGQIGISSRSRKNTGSSSLPVISYNAQLA